MKQLAVRFVNTLTRTHINKEHRGKNEQAPKRRRDNCHKSRDTSMECVKLYDKERREYRLWSGVHHERPP